MTTNNKIGAKEVRRSHEIFDSAPTHPYLPSISVAFGRVRDSEVLPGRVEDAEILE
jgi:hypothetical protein